MKNFKLLFNNLLLVLLILSLITEKVNAQENGNFCATDQILEQMLKDNPEMIKEMEYHNKMAASYKSFSKTDAVYIIPVVFHVIHDDGPENISRAQIINALEILNKDMRGHNSDTQQVHSQFKHLIADIEVEFRLATKDPNGSPTEGINRIKSNLTYFNGPHSALQNLISWNRNHYLNVWVVSQIGGGGGLTILGYAHLPNASNSNDGIVMRHDHLGQTGTAASSRGRTFTHEVGHYFGLFHTFQGGCQPTSNCTNNGDGVCDTPPTEDAHYGCNTNLKTCYNLLVNVHNHMDYSTCRFMFTEGQKNRMHYFLNVSPRSSLHTSFNLNARGVMMPNPGFEAQLSSYCAGAPVYFYDMSYNGEISSVEWEFPTGTPSASNELNPVITFEDQGFHQVIMKVTNENGTTQFTFPQGVYLPGNTRIPAPVTEIFDNLQNINDLWTISEEVNNVSWQINTDVSNIGDNSIYINSYYLTDGTNPYTFDMPILDISEFDNPMLDFNYAYVNKSSFSDSRLRIFVSVNCGQSFLLLKAIPLTTIQTVSEPQNTYFVPDENQWSMFLENLNNFKGAENLIIRFHFTGGNTIGNNLYIDRIRVYEEGAPLSITEVQNLKDNLKIYPNPFKDQLEISVYSSQNLTANMIITDLLGREISTHILELEKNNNQFVFNNETLNLTESGIYILTINKGDTFISKRISFINQ